LSTIPTFWILLMCCTNYPPFLGGVWFDFPN
jgi:hypothetical protein